MLEVKDLYKAFGSTVAVDNISFSIPTGICYGLLGPNGAGKTTIISAITGTLAPDRGAILLDGNPVGPNRLGIKRRMGYVPQEIALYDDLSAADNLRFFGVLYNLSGHLLEQRIGQCLEVAGLRERKKSAVKTFSGGMKRRLNIAAALLHEPDFLVLDEPTVGVDPQSRNLIFETLDSLRTAGKTLLYTTHYMEEAERLCQRVAIMDSGKIVAEGVLDDLHALVPAKTVVKIRLSEAPERLPEALGTEFKLRTEGSLIILEIEDLGRDLPRILSGFSQIGAKVDHVQSEEPTLEEVFLHLTGRVLRD